MLVNPRRVRLFLFAYSDQHLFALATWLQLRDKSLFLRENQPLVPVDGRASGQIGGKSVRPRVQRMQNEQPSERMAENRLALAIDRRHALHHRPYFFQHKAQEIICSALARPFSPARKRRQFLYWHRQGVIGKARSGKRNLFVVAEPDHDRRTALAVPAPALQAHRLYHRADDRVGIEHIQDREASLRRLARRHCQIDAVRLPAASCLHHELLRPRNRCRFPSRATHLFNVCSSVSSRSSLPSGM